MIPFLIKQNLLLVLHKRRYVYLANMMNDAIEVEVNLMASENMMKKVDENEKKIK